MWRRAVGRVAISTPELLAGLGNDSDGEMIERLKVCVVLYSLPLCLLGTPAGKDDTERPRLADLYSLSRLDAASAACCHASCFQRMPDTRVLTGRV